MAYTVLLRPAAERDLKKLPPDLRARLTTALLDLEQQPRPHGITKLTGSPTTWRIRESDYRVIFDIDDDTHTVLVLRIAHRRDVYR